MSDSALLDNYYEPVEKDERLSLRPGRLAWAPVTYLEDELVSAKISETVPSDDSKTTFEVSVYEPDTNPDPPVKSIGLRSSEKIRVARMKVRPVIVMSSRVDGWTDRHGERVRKSTPARLVAPLYTAEPYGAAFVERVQRFEYNSHFWLPANEYPGGKPDRPCLVRLELAGAVREKMIQPVHFRLNEESYTYLRAWFDYFLDGEHGEISKLLAELYEAPTASD